MTSEGQTRGRFVWHDLLTTDPGRAAAFYGGLFPEWTIQKADSSTTGFRLIETGGREAGGIVPLDPAAGLTSHWLGSVAVADCAATERAAERSGGRSLVPTIDVTAVGRSAVIQDPRGATIKAFEPYRKLSVASDPASGQFCWNELLTTDVPEARRFYQSMFGWTAIERPIGETGLYTLFRVEDQDVAGAMSLPADAASRPSWLTYLYAEDVDRRAVQAESLGARVLVPPSAIPGVGRFSVLEDPTGAMFALLRMDR